MSDAQEIANTASEYIETLITEMYQDQALNNHILLGTVGFESPIQIQLIVTRDPNEFMDE